MLKRVLLGDLIRFRPVVRTKMAVFCFERLAHAVSLLLVHLLGFGLML